ncbi:MAG: MoaD/ThiS family protein [Deltaproteobacteria bacterium]|nr:MoaD/ThiS family protein [Deltaproteobacteria bacterium]
MTVTVKLFGTLGQSVPGYDPQRGILYTLPEGATVEDLLAQAGLLDGEARLILLRGVSPKMDDPLQDKDEILVFNPLAGG